MNQELDMLSHWVHYDFSSTGNSTPNISKSKRIHQIFEKLTSTFQANSFANSLSIKINTLNKQRPEPVAFDFLMYC